MDLSNKSLAMMLLAAVVISLGGTIISLNKLSDFQAGYIGTGPTGRVTTSGTTQLEIQDLVGCAVDTNVDFGAGGAGDFTLSTDVDNSVNSFNNCTDGFGVNNCKGMTINNTGNVNINVSINSTLGGAAFLGGSAVDSDFLYELRNGTFEGLDQGCINATGIASWSGLQTVPSATSELICRNMTSTDVSDAITIEYNVTVRSSTPSGTKTTTINVICEQA